MVNKGALQGKLNFEIHWVAYQLQPLAPPEGVPKAVFMEQKFKGQAQYLMKKKQVLSFCNLRSQVPRPPEASLEGIHLNSRLWLEV